MCESKRKRSTARKVAVQAGRASIDPSGLGVVAVAAGPSTTRRKERPQGRGAMATRASIQGTCTTNDNIRLPFFVDKFYSQVAIVFCRLTLYPPIKENVEI